MIHSVPIDTNESCGNYACDANCTKVYRNVNFAKKLLHPRDFNFPVTGWEIFQRGLSKNPDAPCFGTRTISPDGSLGNYEFKTYAQVESLVKRIGSKILQFGVIEPVDTGFDCIPPCYPIGIYSPNCIEWLITEQICNAYALTIVPLYETLGNDSVMHIINETKFKILVIETKCAEKLLKTLEAQSGFKLPIKILIVVGDKLDDKLTRKLSMRIVYWNELLSQPVAPTDLIEFKPAGKDVLNTISYTSGASGIPKGVMVTQEMICCAVNSVINGGKRYHYPVCQKDGLSVEALVTYLSYLPLAHLYERLCVNCLLCQGGKIGVYSGNVKLLLDDAKELKPTVFASVPRVYQKIFDSIMNALSEKSFVVRGIFHFALNSKLDNIKSKRTFKHLIWDTLLFNKLKRLLGGEVQWMLTGSAPLNPIVLNSLKVFFGIPIVNAYGLTECTACGLNQIAEENDATHIGAPTASIEFKLASVPNLEYLVTDRPNPRGELCLRGYNVTMGYFKNPTLTAEYFKDGWYGIMYLGFIQVTLQNCYLVALYE